MSVHVPNVKVTRIADATVEPLTLSDALNYLRLDTVSSADSALVQDLITQARYECETICNRSFVNTQWQLTMDYFPPYSSKYTSLLPPAIVGPMSDRNYWLNLSEVAIQFPYPPLVTVDSVTYVDPSGTTQTLDTSPSAENVYISTGTPGQMTPWYGKIFPITQPVLSAVNITYTAGYGTEASDVPAPVRQAIRYLTYYYYENRDSDASIPDAVYRILDSVQWGYYG